MHHGFFCESVTKRNLFPCFFLDKPASVSLVFRSPGEFFIPKGFSHYEAWENTISGQAVCYALSVLMTVVFHDFGGLLFLVRLKRSSKGWFGPGLQALHSGSRLSPSPLTAAVREMAGTTGWLSVNLDSLLIQQSLPSVLSYQGW